MMNKRLLRRIAFLIGGGMVLALAVGSLIPDPPMPNVQEGDKLMHLSGYGGLAAWWSLLLPHHRAWVWLACALYGVFIEYLQGLTSYRSFDTHDMLANALGALIGLGLAALLHAGWRYHARPTTQ